MEDILASPPPAESKTGKLKKIILPIFGIILLIVLVVGGFYAVIKNKPEILGLTEKETDPFEEVEDLVSEVGKLMLLPDETPQLATVSDLESVSGQNFFNNAQIGDRILIYRFAKKAILYRPSEKIVVEVGVISEGSSPQVSDADNQVSPTPTPIKETDIFLPTELTPTSTISPTPSATISATPTP